MGRSLAAIRTKNLDHLFDFFGLEADPDLVETHRKSIQARFSLEVQELVRLCSEMREQERFKLFREALRLSYESSLVRAQVAV
jgi:hypothetical protein